MSKIRKNMKCFNFKALRLCIIKMIFLEKLLKQM